MKKEYKKSNTKGIVITMAALSVCALTIIAALFFIKQKRENDKKRESFNNRTLIVDMNEIEKLYEQGDYTDSRVTEKIDSMKEKVREQSIDSDKDYAGYIIVIYICCLIFILLVYGAVYLFILRPFDELENYAAELASGNFDIQLPYKRVNVFGQFTWAFDHMRTEITAARENEIRAIENNKTVIATLSHDIKTPVASIRGYAEGLTMNMDSTPERRARYAEVIMRKCDEVKKITDDMFLHSLQDLDKLVIKKETVEMKKLISDIVEDMQRDKGRIVVDRDIVTANIADIDRIRLTQVIENIISNSRKYAPDSEIILRTDITDDGDTYQISIRDFGEGIPDADMPFIFEKFYRGSNVSDKPGAGLGLFIVKYIMEKMNGGVELRNMDKGLMVILRLPIMKETLSTDM